LRRLHRQPRYRAAILAALLSGATSLTGCQALPTSPIVDPTSGEVQNSSVSSASNRMETSGGDDWSGGTSDLGSSSDQTPTNGTTLGGTGQGQGALSGSKGNKGRHYGYWRHH